jgi:hypothetical protein
VWPPLVGASLRYGADSPPAARRQMTASIFAGAAGEWAVARRLQTGVASYPPTSQLPDGQLTPRLALGTQDPGDLGRVGEESLNAHNPVLRPSAHLTKAQRKTADQIPKARSSARRRRGSLMASPGRSHIRK